MALHELDLELMGKVEGYPLDLRTFLEQALHLFLSPAYWLDSLDYLDLTDILHIREMDEYAAFIASIKSVQLPERILEKEQNTEPVDLRDFQKCFEAYQKAIASAGAAKRTRQVKPWVKLMLDIGGNLIEIGLDDYCAQVTDDTFGITDKVASLTVTAIVSSSVNNDLECSFNLLSSHIQNAQEQFAYLIEMLCKKGFNIDRKPRDRNVIEEEGNIADAEYEYLYQ
jgi:hypothetical protein